MTMSTKQQTANSIEAMQEALRDVIGDQRFRQIAEADALEAALDVAQEWRMRLDELLEEEE